MPIWRLLIVSERGREESLHGQAMQSREARFLSAPRSVATRGSRLDQRQETAPGQELSDQSSVAKLIITFCYLQLVVFLTR